MDDPQKWVDVGARALPLLVCFCIFGIVLHHTFWHPDINLSKEVLALATAAGGYLWGVNSKPSAGK